MITIHRTVTTPRMVNTSTDQTRVWGGAFSLHSHTFWLCSKSNYGNSGFCPLTDLQTYMLALIIRYLQRNEKITKTNVSWKNLSLQMVQCLVGIKRRYYRIIFHLFIFFKFLLGGWARVSKKMDHFNSFAFFFYKSFL